MNLLFKLVVFVAKVSFALPTMKAAGPSQLCTAGTDSLRTIDSAFVYVQPVDERQPYLAAAYYVAGNEGRQIEVVWDEMRPATVWATTKTKSGRVSCMSNLVGVNLTIDVPPSGPPLLEWYDVMGRRLSHRPTRHGIYFLRIDGSPIRRVVVIK
mgnify:CR=1 FL=1